MIGHDLECVFCVDIDQRLWLIDPSGETPRRLVNNSVEQFVRAFATFQPAWRRLASNDDASDVVATLIAEIRQIDPDALSSAESFWPIVLEQVREGLL